MYYYIYCYIYSTTSILCTDENKKVSHSIA